VLTIFDHIQEATVLKRFLDELEKNPKRALGSLAAVLLLTGFGAAAAFREPRAPPTPLTKMAVEPARIGPNGLIQALPQPLQANRHMTATSADEQRRHETVMIELNGRKDNDPVTEREVRLLNESGRVTY
jgi:hypothetical protein